MTDKLREEAVRPGQLWIDNDTRNYRGTRFIAVTAVDATHATCESWYNAPGNSRTTRIRLSRFRPNSTGYRLATAGEAKLADFEVSL